MRLNNGIDCNNKIGLNIELIGKEFDLDKVIQKLENILHKFNKEKEYIL